MSVPLRVLIVEDSQSDAQLLLLELRAGGFDPVWERVDTPEAMREALKGRTWDVIISDYVMPRFSGLTALELVKEMGIDLPFIIVTGQVGEETGVEVMKAGANDYVLKGNLKRIVPAIQRELRDAEVRRERKRAGAERDRLLVELERARDELEARVRERTVELEAATEALQAEVAERKRAEDALRESEELARRQLAEIETIYNTAHVGLCVFDRDLRYVRINDRLAEINGVPAAEHIGRTPREVVPDLAPLAEELAGRIFATGQGVSDVEFSGATARQPEIKRTWVEQWIPLKDPSGRVMGINVSVVEVTEQRRMQAEREVFISVIAHDLRNALTSIRGFADLMARPAIKDTLPRTVHRAVEGMASGSRRLERMIGDLLDVSRIEARQLTVEKKPIDLSSLVQDIVRRTEELTKGRAVKVEVHGEIPQIEADPDRIEQVVTNLLSNAGKYSYPDTEITVEVEQRGNDVMVSVTNLGNGVLPEDQSRLFTRFHRTQQAKDEKVPGLGLGLYIVKALIEAHGGRIWVESEPGMYATFRFVLPADRPAS